MTRTEARNWRLWTPEEVNQEALLYWRYGYQAGRPRGFDEGHEQGFRDGKSAGRDEAKRLLFLGGIIIGLIVGMCF